MARFPTPVLPPPKYSDFGRSCTVGATGDAATPTVRQFCCLRVGVVCEEVASSSTVVVAVTFLALEISLEITKVELPSSGSESERSTTGKSSFLTRRFQPSSPACRNRAALSRMDSPDGFEEVTNFEESFFGVEGGDDESVVLPRMKQLTGRRGRDGVRMEFEVEST